MPNLKDKIVSKSVLSLKALVMSLGIAFLFWSLQSSDSEFSMLSNHWQKEPVVIFKALLILIFLSFLNWFGEIKKWFHLVGNISFHEATRQSLISHSLSLLTPNKLGEYGGKCLFFPKNISAKIIALTGFGNLSQLFMTLIFGGFGLWFSFGHLKIYELVQVKWSWMMLLPLLIVIAFCFKVIRQKLWTVFKSFKKIENSKVKKTLLWSGFRYVVFAHQFLFLLWCFGAQLNYMNGITTISLVYLFSSVIPIFAITDVVVKGSIAVTLMTFAGLPVSMVLVTVFVMWLGNTILPAVIGYFWLWSWQSTFIKHKSR